MNKTTTLPKPNLSLPDMLRAWRRARRFSQAQAADTLGRSIRTLQQWEQGRTIPRAGALIALLQHMDRVQTPGQPEIRRQCLAKLLTAIGKSGTR